MSVLLSCREVADTYGKIVGPARESKNNAVEVVKLTSALEQYAAVHHDQAEYLNINKSFPANGVHHNKDVTIQQRIHWRNSDVLSVLPNFMAFISVAYLIFLLFVDLVKAGRPRPDILKFIVFSIIVSSLSRFKHKQWKYLVEAGTSVLLVISILVLEHIIGRRQCMVTFLTFLVVCRILQYKSFFDNFSVCVAYSTSVVALNTDAAKWYYASNVLIWMYFLVSMLLLFVFQRLWYRIWEHTRILMTVKEKQKLEYDIGRALIGAHISTDILDHVTSARAVSPRPSNSNHYEQEQQDITDEQSANSRLFEAAIAAGMLPHFTEAQLSLAQLHSMKGFDRKECAVIAIGFDSSSEGAGDSGRGPQGDQALHALLDKLAATHRVTCVRKFGNVWLGCVGFFKTWESPSVNSYEALLFACEASFLVSKFASRTTFAVDCGTITGGYLNSLNFDLFGQEVRWLLMVLELRQYGRVVVSEAAQKLLSQHKKMYREVLGFKFATRGVGLPWCVGEEMQVGLVENATEMVDFGSLAIFVTDVKDAVLSMRSNSNSAAARQGQGQGRQIDWHAFESLLSEDSVVRTGHISSRYMHPQSRRSDTGDMWVINDSKPCLDQEIGEEFLLSATHRFQLSLNDPIFDKLTDTEIYSLHEASERDLYALIRRVCFPNFLQLWCLYSNYTDTTGKNEYKSVMANADAYSYDWYAGPLWVLFGHTVLARFFTLQTTNEFTPTPPPQVSVPVTSRGPSPRSEDSSSSSVPFIVKVKAPKNYSLRSTAKRGRITPIEEMDEEEEEPDLDEMASIATGVADKGITELPVLDSGAAPTLSGPPSSNTSSTDILKTKPVRKVQQAGWDAECKRGWDKYAGDTRLFFYDSRFNGAVTVMFYLAVWFAVHRFLVRSNRTTGSSEFICVVVLHICLLLFVERRYDNYLSILIFALNALAINALTYNYICFRLRFNEGSPLLPEFGDFGGEVPIVLLALMLVPYHMRQHVFFSFLDSGIVPLMQLLNARLSGITCTQAARFRSIILYMLILLALYYWALQFTSYTSYLLEHKLLPEAIRNYRKQKANSRALLHAFAPHVPNSRSCQLFGRKSYRQCAIAAMHIKTGDQIAHFVDPKDLALVLNKIHQVIEKCIAECGMLSVTHFSGVYLAAACRDCAWDSVESLRFPDTHTARTVVLLRRVRTKLAALSRELKFSIQLGIGIDQGPVQLGFLGQSRFCYDISGPARDLAFAMSSFHGAGAFANEAFDSDIRKMQAPEDLIRDVTSLLEPSRSNGSRWLRIDGSFNGIQLEDFKYLCMLGQGGYGSVHLLAEKHTGVPYAIKAIELKQESKLSKMIERECSILQMIQHPNVVNLKYSFRNHNRLYLVMSYIRGGNLKQVVERDNLDLPHLLSWFAELVLAVEYLHCMGIIHRDVKPANCMIGTDGHLKLADFGLSKVVNFISSEQKGYSRRALEGNDSLGLSYEAFQRVRKFLPLKMDAAQKDDAVESTMHRTIRILLITMDDDKADSTLLFINTTVEIAIADYDIDSDTIRTSNFEAIFIDGDYYEEDGVELVKHFCSMLLNGIPVLMIAKDEERRQRGLKAGARACTRLPLEALNEDMFDILFGPEPDSPTSDPLQRHLVDLVAFQEEQVFKLAQEPVKQASLNKNGTAERGNSKEGGTAGDGPSSSLWSHQPRDSVAVESRSHSLVGTLHFIAPEVIKLRKYGKAVDWWAVGMTFYECLVRKHLFGGDDKKAVFESIMNAPIELTLLEPYGDPIVTLVKGLLCRDIKKRLGSQSIETIKSQKVFEKIDWATVSTGNPVHRPAQFVNRKFRAEDKDLFYGPRGNFDLRRENLDDKNTTSMQKYLLNKKRAKMKDMMSGRSSRSSKRSFAKLLSGGGASAESSGRNRRAPGTGNSKSLSKSKGSGSLELVVEAPAEEDTAVAGLDIQL